MTALFSFSNILLAGCLLVVIIGVWQLMRMRFARNPDVWLDLGINCIDWGRADQERKDELLREKYNQEFEQMLFALRREVEKRKASAIDEKSRTVLDSILACLEPGEHPMKFCLKDKANLFLWREYGCVNSSVYELVELKFVPHPIQERIKLLKEVEPFIPGLPAAS